MTIHERGAGEKADGGEKSIDWGPWKTCEQMASGTWKDYLFTRRGRDVGEDG